MADKNFSIRIGTSGWSYKHWRESFYPKDLPASGQFGYYAARYDTVELNSPFYRLPPKSTFELWKEKSPPGFLFSVKANRFITHMKKLSEPAESTSRFLENVSGLGEKCGPLLFQLPPKWNINTERFAAFLAALPRHFEYVFEFRNPTWYHPEITALLKKYGCAFCIYDLDGHLSPLEVTAPLVYVRLHGPEGKYAGSYSNEALELWATRCIEWSTSAHVFVYFDNDIGTHAPYNAAALRELVK